MSSASHAPSTELPASASDAWSPRGMWAAVARERLRQLIEQQVPRFGARPYLGDEAMLRQQLASGALLELEGDFCWSLNFSADFIGELCWEGFLPICAELGGGTDLFVLLPKLHEMRCIHRLQPQEAVAKPSKKAIKRARGYTLTVGKDFGGVVAGCIAQHGESWLHPPMQAAFAHLASRSATDEQGGQRSYMCSFELWRDDKLVAGELGAVCGCAYTAFSGFHSESGAGRVQMMMTARLLQLAGFEWLDMGQEHAYKLEGGAKMVPRAQFIRELREVRRRPSRLAELAQEEHCGLSGTLAHEQRAPVAASAPAAEMEADAE